MASSVEARGFSTVRARRDDRAATAVALADLVADLPVATSTTGATVATVPEAATTLQGCRAERPAGTPVVNGAVRSLTKNASSSIGTPSADETGGSTAWVFQAIHMTPAEVANQSPAPPAGNAVALVRIVRAG